VLQRQGLIALWHDRNISPGTDWQREIDTYLNSAHIILLLVSPDFMDSDYCYGIEMQRAMQRHEQGLARVLPIILRPVHWLAAPFGKLQVLPTNAKPVLSSHWHNQDEAFFDVAEGIRETVEKLLASPQFTSSKNGSQTSQKTIGRLQGQGEVFYASEQFEEALAAFDQILQIDPSNVCACSWKGAALCYLKRYEESLAAREEAIRLGSTSKEDFAAKGACLVELRRYEEAMTAYNQAIEIDPSYTAAYSGKAEVIKRQKQLKQTR